MKKEYRKPVIEMEEFVPNEYVAVCVEVNIPGTEEWVQAVDVEATQWYLNWKSPNMDRPYPDIGVKYPVFNGSFRVKNPAVEGGYDNYSTQESNYGDPNWDEPLCTIDYCCNGSIYNEYTGEGSWDGYHYHYRGTPNNHS